VILDLGADLFEVTPCVHFDNLEIFKKVAEIFNTRFVGIDFLSNDISKSWKEHPSVIIELNSLPYIDMHHYPTEGIPVNVGGWITDLVEKYYL
jgi:cyanophycin synthetase